MENLVRAINRDNLIEIKKICQSGIDLTTPIKIGLEYELDDYDETNILFYAIRNGVSIEAINILIDNGVDINIIDDDGLSALDIAIKFKRLDVIKLCIDRGFDINSTHRKSGIKPIMLVACFNNIDMAKLLIENGADINAIDKSGLSAKDYAKKLGQKKMLEFLESKGAKYNLYRDKNSKKDRYNIENREEPTQDMGFDSI